MNEFLESSQTPLEEHLQQVRNRLVDYRSNHATKQAASNNGSDDEDPEVVYLNQRSRKRVIFSGEDLVEIAMPHGSRVIYARSPLQGLSDVRGAIHYAVNHPEGNSSQPLSKLVQPGMRVTIAVDDISLPLPSMSIPDLRQTMLEVVLEELQRATIDDIHIIIATAFHRRMTAEEIKKMVGADIFSRYYPKHLYNHDGEDKAKMKWLGHTDMREKVEINRRAAESDLLIYVNINFVPMNGGYKSVATGLAGYATLREHHDPEVIATCNSYMDVDRSSLQDANRRINDIIEQKVNVFHIETAVNNRMYMPPFEMLAQNEDFHSLSDRLLLQGLQKTLRKMPPEIKRTIFQKIPAGYECTAVHAGEVKAVHDKIIQKSYKQYEVRVRGQADILVIGVPYVCPYSVNSILNPLLVQVMALGYIYHLFIGGKPLVKDGGSMIIFHPCRDEFDEHFHPSYIDFFHRLLSVSKDSSVLQRSFELDFACNPEYKKLYREKHAYHGVHPFYMWYWGESGRRRLQNVIVVNPEHKHVPKQMGWDQAKDFETALAMAGYQNSDPRLQVTLLHIPPMLLTRIID